MPLADVRISLPERYRVVRHVANGGMASVWAAEDSVLCRLVAVKVLASHVAADPSSRTRFEREARTAAKVSDHPNVVTIYDVGEHGGIPFIVMELYDAGSMADRLRAVGETRTVPRSQAIAWLEQAAAALDYAHGEGIVHRDVKPANLLLDDRGRLAVADFGIARAVDDSNLTQAGQVLGTAAYLSPEQALGKPATTASDRYALGIVAYELLVGRRPFGGDHIAAQARQHVEAAPPDTDLGPEVDEVLHRAIAKDPDERYPTAARFVEELRAVATRAETPPTEATRRMAPQRAAPAPAPDPAPVPAAAPVAAAAPQPVAPRRGDGGSRRGLLALAGVGLAVLLVALVAIFAGSGGDGEERAARTSTSSSAEKQRTTEEPKTSPSAAPAPSEEQPADAPDNEGEGGAGPSAVAENPRAANDAGYAKLQAGDAAGAVPLLESAVAGFDQQGGSADRTQFGFALYNLAEALRQSGRPDEAIPYYERRLQVNPTDRPEVVKASLAEAREAAKGGGKGKKKD